MMVTLDRMELARIVDQVSGGTDNIEDVLPLAPLQEDILARWLDRQRDLPCLHWAVISVSSRQRRDALLERLRRVVDRHERLRSLVSWEHLSRPVQVVLRQPAGPGTKINSEDIERLQDGDAPDVSSDYRGKLPIFQLDVTFDAAASRWHVVARLHEIGGDRNSLRDVIDEAMAPVTGDSERVSYRRYVVQALEQAKGCDAEDFFRVKLAEIDEPTLPYGLVAMDVQAGSVAMWRQRVQPEFAQRVRALAGRLRVNPAAVFHAAWALVVAHTSGSDEVVCGTAITLSQGGVALSNILPLRLRLQGSGASELIEYAHREIAELLGCAHVSSKLPEQCSGMVSTEPLFSAVIDYRLTRNECQETYRGAGIQWFTSGERSDYPLTLLVEDSDEEFTLIVEAHAPIEPQRVAGYVSMALAQLVHSSEDGTDVPALGLSILPEREWNEISRSFNGPRVDIAEGRWVHVLFEEQAERAPAAIALICDNRSVTYAELDRSAAELARHLRRRGVGPDRPVGMYIERGVHMVVGLLAILKAGGACVPLDPTYPHDRLAYMLQDAGPLVVLTQQTLRATLPPSAAAVLEVDDTGKLLGADDRYEDLQLAELRLNSQQLGYIIYTSGSTGWPKGVAMTHGALANLVHWQLEQLRVKEGERVLQFAALGFDVAMQEIFSTLCGGGTLVLLDEWVRRDPHALGELLITHSIARAFLPPLMLQSLMECMSGKGKVMPSLQHIVTAGEQLHVTEHITAFCSAHPGCRLHNHYGPTETHVVTALTLAEDPSGWEAIPAIGRPLWNTRIYILAHRQMVPIGVPGEIFIAGAAVARGYLNQPRLTAQRFIADPFSDAPGARMYKTGDLGRWRADGTIEYLGRNDQQVKVRGYRIELSEIEMHLLRHEQVREAVVIATEDIPGRKQLVAYVTRRPLGGGGDTGRGEVDVEGLRAHLKSALPDYMIPSGFVFLRSLPLLPSGKLDRRALPKPGHEAYTTRAFEAPCGEIEQVLSAMWEELLSIGNIGRNDNYFDLGGQSLIGLKLISAVEHRFGSKLSFLALYRHPTVREMAQLIERVAPVSPEAKHEFEEMIF